jgi:D-glycero-alpha-D-manno-heptose-7-phosphate kinase
MHDMPPHSRLGTSSSLGVSVIGALKALKKESINKIKIADTATMIERKELGMDNGPQDQYAAALGGINLLEYRGKYGEKVRVKRLRLGREAIFHLEKNLILCYIGSSKVSGDLNHEIVEGYESGKKDVIESISSIKKITYDMFSALKRENFHYFAELLNEELHNRERLNKRIVNALCKKFIKIGMASGARGAKILGAGGGGTILFYVPDESIKKVTKSLEKNRGKIFDFRLDFAGLETWKT